MVLVYQFPYLALPLTWACRRVWRPIRCLLARVPEHQVHAYPQVLSWGAGYRIL